MLCCWQWTNWWGTPSNTAVTSIPCGTVDVSLIRTNRLILIYVRDYGAGFAIGQAGHAAINNPPNNPLLHAELRSQMGLRPGGFGIMLAQQVADELIYNENGNTVLLIKYLDQSAPPKPEIELLTP